MNITGKILVFRNEYGYSTTISKKNQDGSYEKMYVILQLPKEVELQNMTYIEISQGFLTFYKDKNGLQKPKIVVMSFDGGEAEKESWTPPAENTEIPADELPF